MVISKCKTIYTLFSSICGCFIKNGKSNNNNNNNNIFPIPHTVTADMIKQIPVTWSLQ